MLAVELEVTSKNAKTVLLGFNFVSDNAGHRTRRTTAQVTRWVNGLNEIYTGQANITLSVKSNRAVTVPQNLGRVVRFSSHLAGVPAAQHEWGAVTALGDATADMNLFFVWEYEQDSTPLADNAGAGTSGSNCIFEDNVGAQVIRNMAHEIGHFLGCHDHYVQARNREVMFGYENSAGVHLPKQDVDVMNP